MDSVMTRRPSTANMLELTGEYRCEKMRFENDTEPDCIIGEILIPDDSQEEGVFQPVAIKGPAEINELRAGQTYVFFGKWVEYRHKRKGTTEQQFSFVSFVRQAPASRESVISYIAEHGEGHGIGKGRAVKLWEAFGSDAVRICREEPDRVVEVLAGTLKVNAEQAEHLSRRLTEDVATETAKLSLSSLLAGRGFPRSLPSVVIQEWGNKAPQIIARDPYRLMKFKSCGFKRCDAMYIDLGLDLARLKRQALCAWYSVASNTEGHTWYPSTFPDAFLRRNISGDKLKFEKAIELAVRARALSEIRADKNSINDSGTRWFAEGKKADHERSIAQSVVYARLEQLLWPDADLIENVTDHQRDNLRKTLRAPICVFGGSPGTGKTWCVASLVQAIGKIYGFANIAIGAPTGKAAVRVTENLSMRGIPIQAKTWHSHLIRLESNKMTHFPQKFLIGDESSMLDTDLMAAILRARATGTHFLFVGDVNQLPPVGHGAPLRDMIAAGVAYGELREIMRNSGGIVETCASIRDNVKWNPGDNLILDECREAKEQIARLVHWLKQARLQGIDPVWDCQPVVAVNDKSALSRKDVNKLLQAELNLRPGIDGVPFRVDDKLVNTVNGYFKLIQHGDEEIEENQRGEVFVANGELAKVIYIERDGMIAELQSPYRQIEVRFGKRAAAKEVETEGEETADSSSSGCTFDLGYALSVHKSQGSDWPWVLPLLDEYAGAQRICDRSWLYTAISRAKTKCIMIGKRSTANRMCQFSNVGNRKTFLREQILQLSAIEQLAEI